MSRLPFNPASMAAAKAKVAEDAVRPLSVSELAEKIGSALKAGVPGAIRVVGEVTGFRDRTHWYFDLKDSEAVIACVAFANVAKRVGFDLKDGLQVVITGRIDFYSKSGKVSLIVEKIEPVGAGALDLKLKQLIEELRVLGWMNPERKRKLPVLPRKVAVITSRTAAALQDVIDTVRRRCPSVELVVADTRVQGDDAAEEIAAMIRTVSKVAKKLGIDAVLVTRGGGSKEDLWCFNSKSIAEAIVNCSIPVVAAIGHETDTTVAELVADERAATPTQAAMRLTPDRESLQRHIDAMHARVQGSVKELAAQARADVGHLARDLRSSQLAVVQSTARKLASISQRVERASPSANLARVMARLHNAEHRLPRAMQSVLHTADASQLARSLERASAALVKQNTERVDALDAQLRAVSPLAVLERGYSITTDSSGSIIRSVNQSRRGELLKTRIVDGIIESIVTGDAAAGPLKTESKPAPVRKPAKNPPPGPGLFGDPSA